MTVHLMKKTTIENFLIIKKLKKKVWKAQELMLMRKRPKGDQRSLNNGQELSALGLTTLTKSESSI